MTRLLLTLLALLGLAAQAAPAHATKNCAAGSAEIGTLADTQGKLLAAAVQAGQSPAEVSRQTILTTEGRSPVPRGAVAAIPAVLTGIDRARE